MSIYFLIFPFLYRFHHKLRWRGLFSGEYMKRFSTSSTTISTSTTSRKELTSNSTSSSFTNFSPTLSYQSINEEKETRKVKEDEDDTEDEDELDDNIRREDEIEEKKSELNQFLGPDDINPFDEGPLKNYCSLCTPVSVYLNILLVFSSLI